jgi:hypothetical protein
MTVPVCAQTMSGVARRASERLVTPRMLGIALSWIASLTMRAETLAVDESRVRMLCRSGLRQDHHQQSSSP